MYAAHVPSQVRPMNYVHSHVCSPQSGTVCLMYVHSHVCSAQYWRSASYNVRALARMQSTKSQSVSYVRALARMQRSIQAKRAYNVGARACMQSSIEVRCVLSTCTHTCSSPYRESVLYTRALACMCCVCVCVAVCCRVLQCVVHVHSHIYSS